MLNVTFYYMTGAYGTTDEVPNDRTVFEKTTIEFSLNVFNEFAEFSDKNMSYFAYACKTEGKNDISRLISEMA